MNNNIKTFENFSHPINEAVTLPKMPEFLQKAGAKEAHWNFGGPWVKNPPNNAWEITIKTPKGYFKQDDTWELAFFPNGTFSIRVSPKDSSGPFETGGKWKANTAESFTILNKKISGVSMTLTQLFLPGTYN